jgi:hypothetical protein
MNCMVPNYLKHSGLSPDLVAQNLVIFPTEYLRVSYDSQKNSNYFPKLQ